jgi:hypothetical protein
MPGIDPDKLAQGGMIRHGGIDHSGGGRQLVDHPFCPSFGVVIVKSRVCGAKTNDREQRHHLADRSPGRNDHCVTGSDPRTLQDISVLIGSLRELLVGQLNVCVSDRDLPWAALHLIQEQCVNVDCGHVGANQGIEHPAAFWRDAPHISKEAVEGNQPVHRGGHVGDEPVGVRYLGDEADLS